MLVTGSKWTALERTFGRCAIVTPFGAGLHGIIFTNSTDIHARVTFSSLHASENLQDTLQSAAETETGAAHACADGGNLRRDHSILGPSLSGSNSSA